jgi:hypothetical protein
MTVGRAPGTLAPTEILTRYVLFPKWINQEDGRLKADAFMPDRALELSVTRLRRLREVRIWDIGEQVAAERRESDIRLNVELVGRADLSVMNCSEEGLDVSPAPLPNNRSHANIVNWPAVKNEQKLVALKLAGIAAYRTKPLTPNSN